VHVVLHPSVVLHWKAPQLWATTFVHCPVPLQKEAGVNEEPLHAAGVHWWLVPTFRQLPFPSQLPSLPHWLVLVSSLQVACGFLPANTGAQLPSAWPVSSFVQALQLRHVLLQQTFSTQTPLVHSDPEAHLLPLPSKEGLASPLLLLPPEPLGVPPVADPPVPPATPPELPALPPVPPATPAVPPVPTTIESGCPVAGTASPVPSGDGMGMSEATSVASFPGEPVVSVWPASREIEPSGAPPGKGFLSKQPADNSRNMTMFLIWYERFMACFFSFGDMAGMLLAWCGKDGYCLCSAFQASLEGSRRLIGFRRLEWLQFFLR
jgi:hypothetical protein